MRNGANLLGRLLFVLGVCGVVFAYIGGVDLIDSKKPRYELGELMESDFKKGMIVEGDITANLGSFQESYTTTNGVKTGSSDYSYMIPVGEKQYAGFEAKFDDTIGLLDEQTDDTFLVLSGESSEMPEPVAVLGKVKKLPKKTRGFLRSYMLDLGFTEQDVDSYILDYYIVQTSFDSAAGFFFVGIGLILLCVLILVIVVVRSKKNSVPSSGSVVLNNTGDMPSSAFGSAFAEPDVAAFGEESDSVLPDTQEFEPAYKQSDYGSGLGEGIVDEKKSGLSLKLKDD